VNNAPSLDDLTRLQQAATVGVVLLGAGSFVMSHDALHQLTVASQVPRPLACIWPVIVDGFIITASLAVLHTVLRGHGRRATRGCSSSSSPRSP